MVAPTVEIPRPAKQTTTLPIGGVFCLENIFLKIFDDRRFLSLFCPYACAILRVSNDKETPRRRDSDDDHDRSCFDPCRHGSHLFCFFDESYPSFPGDPLAFCATRDKSLIADF